MRRARLWAAAAALAVILALVPALVAPTAAQAASCYTNRVERWWGTYGEASCSSNGQHRAVAECSEGGRAYGDWVRSGSTSSALCWWSGVRRVYASFR